MITIMTIIISVMFVLFAVGQYRNSRRIIHPDEEKSKAVPFMMLGTAFNVICNLIAGGFVASRLPFVVLLGTSQLCILSFSFITFEKMKYVIHGMSALSLLSGLSFLGAGLGAVPILPSIFYLSMCLGLACLVQVIFFYGIYVKLNNLKDVLSSGSVWTNVSLSVDSIYLTFLLIIVLLYTFILLVGGETKAVSIVFVVLMTALSAALGVRFNKASVFVLRTEHERMIVESMKVSRLEVSANNSGSSILYKNVYDRVQDYFISNKPYLKANLTINDIVAVVFTNKLYISKAISAFTGRNFCQFVNYYRVAHAVELFRNNRKLKVSELANNSGFNSVVSFGMAFKLFMGEKPGDWCRKERYRLDKLKK